MSLPIDRAAMPRLDAAAVAQLKLTNVPSDHMAIAEYSHGQWRKARIQAYRPIPFSPLALGLHYAQIVFEGMKAYRMADGRMGVFRTDRHHERFNRSLQRMLMPEIPFALFSETIHTLVDLDRDWIPPGPDSSYYLRPFVIATEERMGLKAADEFSFMVIGGPFRPVYTKPLRVKVERHFTRAANGGTGYAKCAGNYAAAMYPTKLAQDDGFDQVIWTDAKEHAYVEESGTMNLMFFSDGSLITPPTGDTILDGVTRHSVMQIARDMGIVVVERPIEVDEVREGIRNGRITEAFGVGTAASVAPIGVISIDGEDHALDVHPQRTMFALKNVLNDIRFGNVADPYDWMTIADGTAR